MLISQKIRIYPNKSTIEYIKGCFGYYRFIYNNALSIWNEMYENGENPNGRKVRDFYKRNLKKDWESTYSPNLLDNSIRNLERGFKMFYKKNNRHPKFKSRKNSKNSFTINKKNESTIRIKNNKVYLPKFEYGIKLSEKIRFKGIIKECTVSERANKYFISFIIEVDEEIFTKNNNKKFVGIDANIGHFNISEKNHNYDFPLKELNKYYSKISYYQKILSRKQKESNKYFKTKTKLQNIYYKIYNIQNDWLQKFTTMIVRKYHFICIEDLNINGMLKNKRLSKHIIRSLFYRFRVILEYKSNLYGNELIIADMWYPSTQRCARCGNIKKDNNKMKLSDRVYRCKQCGLTVNRDKNSAYNLKIYAKNMVG